MPLSKVRDAQRKRAARGSGPPVVFSGPAIATPEERRAVLTKIIRRRPSREPDYHDIIAASDQLNKLDQLYVIRMQNVNINVELQAELDRTFTVEELRALLGRSDATE